MVENREVAAILDEVADILEIMGKTEYNIEKGMEMGPSRPRGKGLRW